MTQSRPNLTDHGPTTSGHEPDTANVQFIATAIGGLALLAVVALVVVWGITVWLRDVTESPAPTSPPQPTFTRHTEPRLNAKQPEVLRDLRDREAQQLSSYGWVDEDAGVARIPIERAMQLVREQGLPDWPENSTQTEATSEP